MSEMNKYTWYNINKEGFVFYLMNNFPQKKLGVGDEFSISRQMARKLEKKKYLVSIDYGNSKT